MSYKALRTLLEDQKEGTLIHKVICSDVYYKISDTDKNQYPLLHCMITGSNVTFNPSEAMFNAWKVTAYLYMLNPTGGSVGDNEIDEVNDLNHQMEAMAAQYTYNLYSQVSVSSFGSIQYLTSVPTKLNGANVWQITMEIDMLNQNKLCNDC